MATMSDIPTYSVKHHVGHSDPGILQARQNDGMSPGNRIRTLRKERKLTQSEFAEALGWARSTLASVERGHDAPSRELVEAVARYAGVSTDWILQGISEIRVDTPQSEREAILLAGFRNLSTAEQDAILTLAVRGIKDNHGH